MRKLLNTIIKEADYTIKGFGFESHLDFVESTFHLSKIKPILTVSAIAGSVSGILDWYLGMSAEVYIAFLILLISEFATGILASKKEGVAIQSRKLGRIIVKIISYTAMIGVMNIFKRSIIAPEILGVEVNIYSIVYNSVQAMIILQLLISVMENLTRLGLKEMGVVGKFLSGKFLDWFDIDAKKNRTKES